MCDSKNQLNAVMNMDNSDPDKIFKLVIGVPYHKLVGEMSLEFATKYNDQEMVQKAQAYIALHSGE